MNVSLTPSVPNGKIQAISSKSAAHRILICAAFADKPTVIRCDRTNKDIAATAECLSAMGACIEYKKPNFYVEPITTPKSSISLNCNESGSTLRFLLPVVSALGIRAEFVMQGRLPSRPLSPLYEELISHGAALSTQGSNSLKCEGKLVGDEYRIRGDVSSQYISGLLFALTFSGEGGRLIIEGKMESAPYVDMTVDALRIFGAEPTKTEYGYYVSKGARLTSPSHVDVEGDWSNAAFPLCMGAIGGGNVTVCGLSQDSRQGDAKIVELLREFGADVIVSNSEYTVRGGKPLHGIDIDATQIPDLVPVLATVAAVSQGKTVIRGAARLRLKESDRIESVRSMLSSLGADVEATEDGLVIYGKSRLVGGTVDSFNDHRIAMSAAVASVATENGVTVNGAECVEKSYPDFWNDINRYLHLNIEK
ncbi:MAG: 3-phosphoshikimate 1-carboxyvinyltransferase [Ruminococcaceae bacterium]|nr:3-phosphoshikimate 1-carboxyvinyltransferase [Oscillospiraceae bacterium]